MRGDLLFTNTSVEYRCLGAWGRRAREVLFCLKDVLEVKAEIPEDNQQGKTLGILVCLSCYGRRSVVAGFVMVK